MQGNGGYVATQYDALGRQTEITGYAPNPNPIAGGTATEYYDYQLAYDQFGNLRQQVETYPGGQLAGRTVDLSYDSDDRLATEALVTGNPAGGGTSTTVTTAYGYDASHNQTSKVVTQTVGSNTTQLANITIHIDGNSNLVTWWMSHDASGNSTGVTSYLYDNNGCPTQISLPANGEIFIYYDYEHRPVSVSSNLTVPTAAGASPGSMGWRNFTATYAYDYRTRRMWREETQLNTTSPFNSAAVTKTDTKTAEMFSGGTSVREYDVTAGGPNMTLSSAAPVAGNWTPSNTTLAPATEYIRGSDWGGGVGGILYALHANAPSYYHYDGRGDVVAQTTGMTGNLSYQAAYNAEGGHNPTLAPYTQSPENLPAWGAQEWTAAGAQTDRYRTNTKEEDPLGWINDGQRIRIPGLGRFLTPDPLGFADGTNPYTYVHNNPFTYFDAEGLMTGQEYVNDAGDAEQTYQQKSQALAAQFKANHNTNYRELLNDAMAERDNRVQTDRDGLTNLVEYAQFGEAHGYGHINPLLLDDEKDRTRSNRSAGGKLFDNIENAAFRDEMVHATAWTLATAGAGMVAEEFIATVRLTKAVADLNKRSSSTPVTPSAPATMSPAASDIDSAAMHTVDFGPTEDAQPFEQQQVAQQQQANPGSNSTVKVRGTKGADGGTSQISIEHDANGDAISRTHTVTKDWEIIHQHQEQLGVDGSVRGFPDEWTGTPTINDSDIDPHDVPQGPKL